MEEANILNAALLSHIVPGMEVGTEEGWSKILIS